MFFVCVFSAKTSFSNCGWWKCADRLKVLTPPAAASALMTQSHFAECNIQTSYTGLLVINVFSLVSVSSDHDSEGKRVQDMLSTIDKPQVGTHPPTAAAHTHTHTRTLDPLITTFINHLCVWCSHGWHRFWYLSHISSLSVWLTQKSDDHTHTHTQICCDRLCAALSFFWVWIIRALAHPGHTRAASAHPFASCSLSAENHCKLNFSSWAADMVYQRGITHCHC